MSCFSSEVNSGFFYKTAAEREKLVLAEREFIMRRVQKIVDLKKKVCDETKNHGPKRGFVVINQKVEAVSCFHSNFTVDIDILLACKSRLCKNIYIAAQVTVS